MRPVSADIDPQAIDARYRTLVIMWLALMISIGLYVFMTRVAVTPAQGNLSGEINETNRMILWGCVAVGGLTFLLSFVFKQRFLKQSVEQHDARLVQTGLVLAWALCEATCLFGLLAYFLTRNPYAYLLFALAVLGFLLHFPRKSQLINAVERQRFGM
jgi:ABC-type Mn2+/Zn2+ transport system permease subunit